MNNITYVISLRDDNIERRANIQKQLKGQFEYTILDAVVGSTIDKSGDQRLKDQSQHLRAGQIGCALSHIQCYEHAKERNLEFVLIFEDDFQLKADVSIDLDTITKNLKGNSICLLLWGTFPGETLHFDGTTKFPLPSGRHMYHLKSGRPLCGTGYICTREAYLSLLQNLLPLQTVADDWPRFLNKGFINDIYLIDPAPIDIRHFESQIGYGGGGGRLKRLAAWTKNKKIPVLKWIANWHLKRQAKKNRKRAIV